MRYLLNSISVHPWMHERWLLWGNRVAAARRRPAETLFALAASLVGVLLLLLLLRSSGQVWLEAALDVPVRHPLPAFTVSATCCFLLARRSLDSTHRVWQFGWLAALPVTAAQVRQARWVLVASETARLVGILLLFGLAALLSGMGPAVAVAGLLPPTTGLLTGALLTLLTDRWCPSAGVKPPRRQSTRLLLPDILPARALRSISGWQRVLLAQRWRLGAGWPWVVAGGLLLPGGEGMRNSAGFLLLVLAVAWWQQALTAAARCIRAADALLRAQPLQPSRFVRACLRYPLLASVSAGGIIVVALLLMGAPVWLASTCLLSVIGYALLQLSISLRYRRQPQRARVVLAVDLVAAVLLWQALPPLALLLPLRIHQHLVLARRIV